MALKSTRGLGEDKVEIEELLERLSKQVDRLKTLYEQYFMGIMKVPPSQLHRDVERTIRELTQQQIRNTALRYRFTTLSQKFGSYNTYWKRILRDIEAGRYVRDVRRASRRAAAAGMDMPAELVNKLPRRLKDRILRDREQLAARAEREGKLPADEEAAVVRSAKPHAHRIDESELDGLLDGDLDMDALFGAITKDEEPTTPSQKAAPKPEAAPRPAPKPAPRPKPAPAPRTTRARRAPPPSAPPPGMSENQARDLFQRYVQARQLVGERTDNVTYDKLMGSLNKQAPAIMKQHRAKGVEFNVVVKDDKVVLKAKPKR